jgi:FdhD protein
VKAAQAYQAVQFNQGGFQQRNDWLVAENPLRISINGEALTVTMCTPGDEVQLLRGLLYGEDLFRRHDRELEFKVTHNPQGFITDINAIIPQNELRDGYMNSRQLLSVASCGICGRTTFNPPKGTLEHAVQTPPSLIQHLFAQVMNDQPLFALTGGCHSAAIADRNGKVLTVKEDIGRHNAVDKAIGQTLMDGTLHQGDILLVSGRVSYEIMAKCFMAGLHTLAAVSAPSALSVDFAKEWGIELIGFCRDQRMTVYSTPNNTPNGHERTT